jgi:hypothetical protein
MPESAATDLRIVRLERQVRLLTASLLVILIVASTVTAAAVRTFSVRADEPKVFRTRGIVI